MKDDITIIKPKKRIYLFNIKELWKFKKLFYMLAKRDISVKYKQAIIGGLWALIKPFFTMVIFTVFFGNIIKVPSDDIPYAIFSYSGILIWSYFATSVGVASESVVANAGLVSKIYFPRIIIPISSTLVGLVDYVVAMIVMLGLMIYYKVPPNIYILLVPVVLFFTWILATGMGFWFSALNVKYRDTRYIVSFLTQSLIFMTPVIYPVSILGDYKWILSFNPMTGFVQAHRAAILGHQVIDFKIFGIAIALSIIIFISGLLYFNSVERYFADVI